MVLELWQFLHTERLQKEHGLTDSFVSEVVPMSQAVLEGFRKKREGEEQALPSILELITVSKECFICQYFLPPLSCCGHFFFKSGADEARGCGL